MTRLYFDDQYLTAFDAEITARSKRNGQPAVALDQTAFYPEGGGQPADHGTLNGVRVVDVQSDGDVVWHMLDDEIAESAVHGEVDWDRRFDHMQQHHGQHLLSAAFENLFGLHTVSFHLGPASATIDLDSPTISDDQIRQAEALANRVIWEDHPVQARFVTKEELAQISLRKAPTVEGPIRVVSVTDFDHSACGGTHPRSTGGVGVLHIRKRERRGETTRVEFACGQRVLADLRVKHDLLQRLCAGFTVGLDEIEAAVERLRDSESITRKELTAAQESLRAQEVAELLDAADRSSGVPVVTHLLEDRPVSEAQAMARELAAGGAIAILGVRGPKAHVIVARPGPSDLDCAAVLREVVGRHGGRGGGRAELAQGGLPPAADLGRVLAEIGENFE